MDRFKELQVFIRVAQRRSFLLASEDLLIPRSTVTNVVKRMEARLGVRLLERTTRKVGLTHEGEAYYQRAINILSDLEEMDTAFSDTSPKGILRANLQGTLAKHFVVPKLNDFLVRYPDVTLQLAEDDRLVDLVGEGFDCALRAGNLQDSSLIAKPIALMPQVTVASPQYLKQLGSIDSLEVLKSHFAVGYSLDAAAKPNTLEFRHKEQYREVVLPARIYVAGADLYTGAALAGLGIIQVPKYRIAEQLRKKLLVEILPDHPPPPMPVSVIYPQKAHLSPRTRAFVQWLNEIFHAQI